MHGNGTDPPHRAAQHELPNLDGIRIDELLGSEDTVLDNALRRLRELPDSGGVFAAFTSAVR